MALVTAQISDVTPGPLTVTDTSIMFRLTNFTKQIILPYALLLKIEGVHLLFYNGFVKILKQHTNIQHPSTRIHFLTTVTKHMKSKRIPSIFNDESTESFISLRRHIYMSHVNKIQPIRVK
jgi:hypothetical protein